MTRALLFVRASYWFIPTIYGVFAFILAFLSHQLDQFIWVNDNVKDRIPTILLADFELAYTLLSTIATSILTMTSISFSSILVVMTTYVSQFSPRSLQNFITDHHTQRILGVFISGFVYALVLLLLTKHFGENPPGVLISPLLAVLIAIVAVGFFVFFVHHVAKWIQVRNLIQNIFDYTLKVMDQNWKDMCDKEKEDPWEDWEGEEVLDKEMQQIRASRSGYVQWIDYEGLKKAAEEDGVIVELLHSHGDYLGRGLPLMKVYGDKTHINEQKYARLMIMGNERESVQDVRYGIVKIVEIAARSLSPGINDPFTAIECINYLGHTLSALTRKDFRDHFLHDKHGNLLVVKKVYSFREYLYQSFFQIRFYGREDVAVQVKLLDALYEVASHSTKAIRSDVWHFAEYVAEGLRKEAFLNRDLDRLQGKIDRLAVIASPYRGTTIRLRQSNNGFDQEK
ncbi:DUF2254 domain-containing protein [Alteribacter natronophilus]|uniref:DUF2254 domain-containing protein n=1 Tax=Alteribacter natronophilus TaxID=2583810 RepID=UPI00110E384D|nr:DUF2254 domain-containing protein [Alteribacter natronophilus]TMW71532.1 DUF2254 domain-containing protein [Alteribacter natronophilus]